MGSNFFFSAMIDYTYSTRDKKRNVLQSDPFSLQRSNLSWSIQEKEKNFTLREEEESFKFLIAYLQIKVDPKKQFELTNELCISPILPTADKIDFFPVEGTKSKTQRVASFHCVALPFLGSLPASFIPTIDFNCVAIWKHP